VILEWNKQHFHQADETPFAGGAENTVLYDIIGYTGNPIEYIYVTDNLKEVVVTGSLEWVHSDDIDGIAFVFHVDSIKDQTYPCNGMANAYFCLPTNWLLTLMLVLFLLSTTINCRVCRTRVASGVG
jgi:hypothetical protein